MARGHRRTKTTWRTRPYSAGPKGSMRSKRKRPASLPTPSGPEVHYTRVEDVNLRHRFDQDGVMRTPAEWAVIHEAFRRKHARQDAKRKNRRQSAALF